MKLFIDAGNSFIKTMLVEDNQHRYQQFKTADYQVEMKEFLNKLTGIESVWVSSVLSDDFGDWMKQTAAGIGHPSPEFAKISQCSGSLTVAYDDPESFGVDRFLALIAAYEKAKRAVIVIDAGTAITIDAVNDEGGHLGGVIMPGLGRMFTCLVEAAGQISIERTDTVDVFSKNTGDGLSSGCYYAALSGIQAVVGQMEKNISGSPELILTGGDAGSLSGGLGKDCRVVQNLVLDGLELVAQ